MGLVCHSLHTTRIFKATSVPVLESSTLGKNIFIKTLRVNPGDVLDVYADLKVTNDAGRYTTKARRYTVGVGYNLSWYDAQITPPEARLATWAVIGDSAGENVTVDTHHLMLNIGRTLLIPATWVPGQWVGIVLRVAAMSSSWDLNSPTGGDTLTVDQDGILKVWRWAPPPAPAQEG